MRTVREIEFGPMLYEHVVENGSNDGFLSSSLAMMPNSFGCDHISGVDTTDSTTKHNSIIIVLTLLNLLQKRSDSAVSEF